MKMLDFIETLKDQWIQYTGEIPDKIILPYNMYLALKSEAMERMRITGASGNIVNLKMICGVYVNGIIHNNAMTIVSHGRKFEFGILKEDLEES